MLTGAEGLSFDDFFPQSAAPPRRDSVRSSFIHPLVSVSSTSSSESSLDDINLRFSGLGISLDFPSPPYEGNCVTPTVTKRREHSPTSSIASTHTTSSSGSSVKASLSTPPTSDDECTSRLKRAPTCKSHRASIVYTKSTTDLRQSVSPSFEEDCWTEEDAAWFAEDISDIITLASPLPPSFPMEQQGRARPDSVMPPPRSLEARGRQSKIFSPAPPAGAKQTPKGPSLQLDPMFPARKRSFRIPDHLPPPPPSPPTHRQSTMEEETDDLLAQLARAALNSGFIGTNLIIPGPESSSTPPTPSSGYIVTASPTHERQRPPPRMSIPADISDSFDDGAMSDEFDGDVYLSVPQHTNSYPAWPSSPGSVSIYSQPSMVLSPASPVSVDFDFDIVISSESDVRGSDSPFSPTMPDSPEIMRSNGSHTAPERTLRSRWSSSTLGSLAERQAAQSSSSSWIPRFNLSPSKKNKNKVAPVSATTTSAKRSSALKSPLSPTSKKLSFDLDGGLQRRDSRSSRMSDGASDSGDSSTSSGLRRKPIPVEIFMRT